MLSTLPVQARWDSAAASPRGRALDASLQPTHQQPSRDLCPREALGVGGGEVQNFWRDLKITAHSREELVPKFSKMVKEKASRSLMLVPRLDEARGTFPSAWSMRQCLARGKHTAVGVYNPSSLPGPLLSALPYLDSILPTPPPHLPKKCLSLVSFKCLM